MDDVALKELANALHVISSAIWVGGLFFILLTLRGAAAALPDDTATPLWQRVMGRFTNWVWLCIFLSWLTGVWMMFFFYDGFGSVHVDTMFLTALIMTVVFHIDVIGPQRRLKAAAAGDGAAAAALSRSMLYKWISLVLGILTIAIAYIGTAMM